MTVYGGNGCYGEYGWRADRGVTVIYNPSGQEIGYVDPTTVDSVSAYIWNLDPHNPGIGVCKLPCTPVWICEPGQTGWEIDGCGNKRENQACTPPQIGSISFTSTPSGAKIFIDGTDQGVNTPNTISNMPVGTHTYDLKLAGYNDYTGSVSVTLNQTAAVSATLTPACIPVWQCEPGQTGWEIDGCGNKRENQACTPQQTGSASFTSTPPGAEIYIDGENLLIRTPATLMNMAVGTHTYKLVLAGYRDATGTFTIEAGKTTTVSVPLKKAEAAVGTGTIIGLGLLGAGVLGAVVYATREKKGRVK